MQIENQIGNRIKEAREIKGMTLAEVSQHTGVTAKTLSNWEANKSQPRPNKMQTLCGVLGVPLVWLLEGDAKFDPSLAWSSRLEKLHSMVQKLQKLQLAATHLNTEIANELAEIRRIEQDIDELAQ